jgi:hypothetical protein
MKDDDDDWAYATSMFYEPWTTYPGVQVTNLGPEVRWWERVSRQERTWWDLCQDCAEPLTRNPHIHDRALTPQGLREPLGSAGRGVRPKPVEFADDAICYLCDCRLGNE